MHTIKVTIEETVNYEFEIEVKDDFKASYDTVAELAEEVFTQMEAPPVTVIDRELIDWEEVKHA